eukprot:CAMPEP_0168536466 /NCGR_PEP_ID=MMETSP0405-20121227/19575_1 /TAXON_ID=498012 /ORGANISM="Trichosphaerium sp, Strain Am-I-7 wt" /LENGTH=429 /DNA_ID=CAMNT_0008564495 /DNA_START=293 /DNA_END=1582 /DNA_ORIENTATION=-
MDDWIKCTLKRELCIARKQGTRDLDKIVLSLARKINRRRTLERLRVEIRKFANVIANHKSTGIGYHIDKHMGTNRNIFSIIGPHTGVHYGDIIIVLAPEIMRHPDFNMTPQAATAFHSGKVYNHRPFCQTGKKEKRELCDASKVNAGAIRNWPEVLATDICAQYLEKKGRNAALKSVDVLDFYMSRDSHFCWEGHLPSLTPLSYVQNIIIPDQVWKQFTRDDKSNFHNKFRHQIQRCKSKGRSFRIWSPTNPPNWNKHAFSSMVHIHPPFHRDHGFAFTLECLKTREAFLPARFRRNGGGTVSFTAKGINIFITLSTHGEPSFKNKNAREYHIGIMAFEKHESWIKKGNGKGIRPIVLARDFHSRFNTAAWIDYTINYDSRRGIEVFACQRGHKSRPMVLNDNNPLRGICHVGFSCWNHPVEFKKVIIA